MLMVRAVMLTLEDDGSDYKYNHNYNYKGGSDEGHDYDD